MLNFRSVFQHPNGSSISLPRLIPSFSSKGFAFIKDDNTGATRSEVSRALTLTGPFINDSILLSAYDLFFDYLDAPEQHYGSKELVIIDSGGYELAPEFELREPISIGGPYRPEPGFGLMEYRQILSSLPADAPIMIANFDFAMRGSPISDQVVEALELFDAYPQFLHSFVVRPSGGARFLDAEAIIAELGKMRRFHALGVTETELGRNLYDRMKAIAQLRLAMSRTNLTIPIHVCGGLDPIVTPLYFLAGAELFDGVSWLRYGYSQDAAIPRESYHVVESGIQTSWPRAEAIRLARNLSYLEYLTTQLRRFRNDGGTDFSLFGRYSVQIESAFRILQTNVPGLKGGD